MPDLNTSERKIFSQNGEDGIVAAIFDSIGTTNTFTVEFGVGDGRECNSAHLICDLGWSGLLIEADERLFSGLAERYQGFPKARLAHRFVTAENIAQILAEQEVPVEPDLLSIDVDGNDYWVWKALDAYRPRVVTIEYNAAHPAPGLWVMAYDPKHVWRGDSYFGASLASLVALGKRKGYALLATDSKGVNAFFLRRDLLTTCRFKERSPKSAYHPPGFVNASGTYGHPPGEGPFLRM